MEIFPFYGERHLPPNMRVQIVGYEERPWMEFIRHHLVWAPPRITTKGGAPPTPWPWPWPSLPRAAATSATSTTSVFRDRPRTARLHQSRRRDVRHRTRTHSSRICAMSCDHQYTARHERTGLVRGMPASHIPIIISRIQAALAFTSQYLVGFSGQVAVRAAVTRTFPSNRRNAHSGDWVPLGWRCRASAEGVETSNFIYQ